MKILTPPLPWHKVSVKEGRGDVVVLLHGLWRSREAMEPMATYLNAEHDMTTVCIPYDSVRDGFSCILDKVSAQMELLGLDGKVHFVTHSLGGVILSGLLERENRHWHLGRAVMLAPPLNGSQIVEWLRDSPLRHVLGHASTYLKTSEIRKHVPTLKQQERIAVIMGSSNKLKLFSQFLDQENDGIVSVDDGRVDGLAEFHIEEVDHTFITADKKIQQRCAGFLGS